MLASLAGFRTQKMGQHYEISFGLRLEESILVTCRLIQPEVTLPKILERGHYKNKALELFMHAKMLSKYSDPRAE